MADAYEAAARRQASAARDQEARDAAITARRNSDTIEGTMAAVFDRLNPPAGTLADHDSKAIGGRLIDVDRAARSVESPLSHRPTAHIPAAKPRVPRPAPDTRLTGLLGLGARAQSAHSDDPVAATPMERVAPDRNNSEARRRTAIALADTEAAIDRTA
jgi:hypothetical protein